MDHIDRKLRVFEETVMKEAQEKKNDIENELNKKKKDALERFELDVLEKAYAAIQKEKADAIRRKNEAVSKVLSESRRALLVERERMVNEIFANVRRRLQEFKATEEYKDYLLSSAKGSIAGAGEGDIVLLIDPSDKSLADWLSLVTGKEVRLDSMAIEGGCRAFNKTKNIIFDNSLAIRIQEEKEKFLEDARLSIV